jgi:PhnB protein
MYICLVGKTDLLFIKNQEKMKSVNPYMNFNGNTEEAFNFYKSVFGGEFAMIVRYKDTPQAANTSKGDEEKIMHIALPLKNGQVLMATDACDSMGHTLSFGNNFYISISAESETEARELFGKLSAGGKVTVPFDKMFWGDMFGQATDQFGTQWMISFSERN